MSLEFRLEPFNVEDKEDIVERFGFWIERLECYFIDRDVKDDAKRINTFKMVSGDGIMKLYHAMEGSKVTTYEELVQKFKDTYMHMYI